MTRDSDRFSRFWQEENDLMLNTIRIITTANKLYTPYYLTRHLQISLSDEEIINDGQKLAPVVQRIH